MAVLLQGAADTIAVVDAVGADEVDSGLALFRFLAPKATPPLFTDVFAALTTLHKFCIFGTLHSPVISQCL